MVLNDAYFDRLQKEAEMKKRLPVTEMNRKMRRMIKDAGVRKGLVSVRKDRFGFCRIEVKRDQMTEKEIEAVSHVAEIMRQATSHYIYMTRG